MLTAVDDIDVHFVVVVFLALLNRVPSVMKCGVWIPRTVNFQILHETVYRVFFDDLQRIIARGSRSFQLRQIFPVQFM